MASAREMINSFTSDLENKEDEWDLHAANPFASAYESALEGFKETIKAQKEADKADLELALLALSLCSGGLLTAAFGTAVIKNIMVDKAVDIIAKNNMERAFKAAHFLATNKTASFIVGSLYDEAEKRVGGLISDKIKQSFNQNPQEYKSINDFTGGSTKMAKTLENFVLEAKTKLHNTVAEFRDNDKVPDAEKLARLEKIKLGKFWNSPKKSFDNGKMTDEIELSFYLRMILQSDYLRIWYKSDKYLGEEYGYPTVHKRVNIEHAPSATDYPKGTGSSWEPGTVEVMHSQLGGKIVERINKLHKARFGGVFLTGKIDHHVLHRAEATLNLLAAENVKRLVQNAGS
jgi:hypothetical protein